MLEFATGDDLGSILHQGIGEVTKDVGMFLTDMGPEKFASTGFLEKAGAFMTNTQTWAVVGGIVSGTWLGSKLAGGGLWGTVLPGIASIAGSFFWRTNRIPCGNYNRWVNWIV